jgi:hypothetical protein
VSARCSSEAVWSAACAALLALACQTGTGSRAAVAESPETCQANQTRLIQLLESLPDKGLAVRGRADLPVASLAGVIGSGPVVDLGDDALLLDGAALPGADTAARLTELESRLRAAGGAGVGQSLLYLAVPASTDARTLRKYLRAIPRAFDVHLVFQAPAQSLASAQPSSVAERLRSEPDLPKRQEIARAAYAELARCPELLAAVDGVAAGDPSQRWPALRSALLTALPSCQCAQLDTAGLRDLLLAEQRAGAAAVGSVPFEFMRDERCGASFGLNPVQRVLQDIESFDEKFAGSYAAEALSFDQVVTNERLLNYLCQALPGETLAALQRERRTFFWKVPGHRHCQAWQFEPAAPGSPMGTWRRRAEHGQLPLAVHYWQGAEEIRLYGPVPDTGSQPTDERSWSCDQDFRMRGVSADSIELERGRWFFEADACEKSSDDQAAFPGCVTALAGGPPDTNNPPPPTFPADTVTREPPPRPTAPPPAPRQHPRTSAAEKSEENSAPEK